MPSQYILELQQKIYPHQQKNIEYVFLGYIDKVFTTLVETANYYNENHPHMPKLLPYRNQVSDWDPKTSMRCVLRKYEGYEYRRIPEFK